MSDFEFVTQRVVISRWLKGLEEQLEAFSNI